MRFVGGDETFVRGRGAFGSAGGGTPYVGPAISIQANRISGTAPCGVLFEADAFGFGAANPAHDLRFAWTFSDTGLYRGLAKDHPHGRDMGRAYGPMAAHLFREAGSYLVTLEVTNGAQTLTSSLTVTVSPADLLFAGPTTYAISATNDWSDAPIGAQQVSSLAEAITLAQADGHDVARFLLQSETIHDTSGLPLLTSGDFTKVAIGRFGPGRRPVLSHGLDFSASTLSGELVLSDLSLRGSFDANLGGVPASDGIRLPSGACNTLVNLDIKGFGDGISIAAGTCNTVIADCRIGNWARHGIRIDGSDRCAILGTEVAQAEMAQPTAATGAAIRIGGSVGRTVIWHCDLFSNAGGTAHAPCLAWNADAQAAANGVVGFTRMEGGSPILQIAPETPGTPEVSGSLLVDKCILLATANTGAEGLAAVGYGGTTLRNSIFVLPGVTAENGVDVPGFLTGGAGSRTPLNSAQPVTLRSNAFIDLRNPVTLQNPAQGFAVAETSTTGHFTAWTEAANLISAASLATPILVSSGLAEEPVYRPRYLGRRSGADSLDKAYATPASAGALFQPLSGIGPVTEVATGPAALDDFFGRLRGGTPSAGAIEIGLPISVQTLPSGEIQLDGFNAGTLQIEISGAGPQDGSYTLTADRIGGAPRMLTSPFPLGTTNEGDTVSAAPAPILYDSRDGRPVSRFDWFRSGVPVGSSPSYTISPSETIQGLLLIQTSTGAEGQGSAEREAVAPIGYTEVPVVPSGATLSSPGVLSSASPSRALLFAKVKMPSETGTNTLMRGPTGDYDAPTVQTVNSGEALRVSALTTASAFDAFNAPDDGLLQGDVISFLVRTDVGGSVDWYMRDDSGVWTGRNQNLGANPLATAAMALVSRTDGSRNWSSPIYRIALWYDVDADIADPMIQRQFVVPSSGALAHPLISQSIYGTPVFDFYGDAADWNAGIHHGSLPSFTHSGGLFANAS